MRGAGSCEDIVLLSWRRLSKGALCAGQTNRWALIIYTRSPRCWTSPIVVGVDDFRLAGIHFRSTQGVIKGYLSVLRAKINGGHRMKSFSLPHVSVASS